MACPAASNGVKSSFQYSQVAGSDEDATFVVVVSVVVVVLPPLRPGVVEDADDMRLSVTCCC